MLRLPRVSTASSDRGASAVEAGLVVSVVLVPLLVGVLQWGDYFWRAQEASSLAPSLPTGSVAGEFSCAALKSAVAAEVLEVVDALEPELDPVSATVEVLEVLPDVGVLVQVTMATAGSDMPQLFPMPNDGAIVVEFTLRLDDVQLSGACA